MKITEIQIRNFGKLHQMNIRPLAGINVIYGQNESGKSTMRQFITAMLFGLEKQRGKSGRNDVYQQYEPWNSSSYYSGGLRFETDGKPFLLERNFYHKEKSARLVSESDLEELSVEHRDLEVLLGGMKRETYENTYCIGQAAIETEKEFAGILQNYFVNTSHTGEAGIDLAGAKKKLKARQKEAERSFQQEADSRKELEEKLGMEEHIICRDVEQLENQLRQMKKEGYVPRTAQMLAQMEDIPPEKDHNQMAEYLRREREAKEEKRCVRRKAVSLCVAALGLLGGAWNLAGNGIGRNIFGAAFEAVMILVFSLGLAAAFYFQSREKKIQKLIQEQESEWQESPADQEQYRRELKEQEERAKKQAVVETLQAQLWEKKTRLINLREELDECRIPGSQEMEWQEQVRAYQLALDTLTQISGEVYQDTRQQLEDETARILSEITGEKYDKVALDEKMELMVYAGDRKLYPWQLSRGTMEQMYLALRLAAGRCFTKEESLPILLDEAFVSFDDVRLERTLKWLAAQKEQILLFTCQKREMELLLKNGISYGKIVMDR